MLGTLVRARLADAAAQLSRFNAAWPQAVHFCAGCGTWCVVCAPLSHSVRAIPAPNRIRSARPAANQDLLVSLNA